MLSLSNILGHRACPCFHHMFGMSLWLLFTDTLMICLGSIRRTVLWHPFSVRRLGQTVHLRLGFSLAYRVVSDVFSYLLTDASCPLFSYPFRCMPPGASSSYFWVSFVGPTHVIPFQRYARGRDFLVLLSIFAARGLVPDLFHRLIIFLFFVCHAICGHTLSEPPMVQSSSRFRNAFPHTMFCHTLSETHNGQSAHHTFVLFEKPPYATPSSPVAETQSSSYFWFSFGGPSRINLFQRYVQVRELIVLLCMLSAHHLLAFRDMPSRGPIFVHRIVGFSFGLGELRESTSVSSYFWVTLWPAISPHNIQSWLTQVSSYFCCHTAPRLQHNFVFCFSFGVSARAWVQQRIT